MTEKDLLRAHAAESRARDGLPTEQQEAARVGAQAEIEQALTGHLVPDGLTMSPLGPGWTDRFHAQADVLPDAAVLRARGWWPLGRLLDDPTGRRCWAVVVGGRTVAAVVLSVEPHDAASVVIDRCLERGQVRLREVLELRELARSGARLPASSRVLEVAADIETGLGDRELVRWATGRRLASPSSLPGRRRRRTAPFALAVSGVDGSGKSSLSHQLTSSLHAASVDVSHVWLRPGMGLGPLVRLATFGKRLAGQEPSPGVRAVAEERGSSLRSRRGAVGWAWVGLVTFAFVVGVRNQRRSAGPVVLHDRHVVDALATLDFAYAGVDLRHVRWLVRTFVPAVDVAFYLEVPPELAVARKPGDVLGEFAVRRQLEAYARHLMGQGIQVLDGTTERDVIAATALETVSRTACEPKRRRRLRR